MKPSRSRSEKEEMPWRVRLVRGQAKAGGGGEPNSHGTPASPTTSLLGTAAGSISWASIYFPPCFKERREQSGGSNGSATSVVQVRCRRAADGATATELYMICMPPSNWQAGLVPKGLSGSPPLLAFRDHSTPPNRTTERAGIIAVLMAWGILQGKCQWRNRIHSHLQ